jgi:hypothetical protein
VKRKITDSSQIKSTQPVTKLAPDIYGGLATYVGDFTRDYILAIMRAQDVNARISAQGKDFKDLLEKQELDRVVERIVPSYLKELEDLGFPDVEISGESHKKILSRLLKRAVPARKD